MVLLLRLFNFLTNLTCVLIILSLIMKVNLGYIYTAIPVVELGVEKYGIGCNNFSNKALL